MKSIPLLNNSANRGWDNQLALPPLQVRATPRPDSFQLSPAGHHYEILQAGFSPETLTKTFAIVIGLAALHLFVGFIKFIRIEGPTIDLLIRLNVLRDLGHGLGNSGRLPQPFLSEFRETVSRLEAILPTVSRVEATFGWNPLMQLCFISRPWQPSQTIARTIADHLRWFQGLKG
ncbi:MAG: hypothetical protein HY542_04125 [Deltaproteobacteria bacterium]|nr:hypothetical protein [Deltaproteobacteria bacterium]